MAEILEPADQPETNAQQPEKQEEEAEPYTVKMFLSDMADLAESVFLSVFLVMVLFTYLFTVSSVEGDSMVPTLEDGDRLVVWRTEENLSTGDVLIIDSETAGLLDDGVTVTEHNGLDKRIVKRLIAQGGQEVNIDFQQGIVYVDGTALDEPYINAPTTFDHRAFTYPFTVPEGYIFVLGDNRHISKDSRHPDVGLIPTDEIVGKVILRVLPVKKFGTID